MNCLHCKKNLANRSRGLCCRCYNTTSIVRNYRPIVYTNRRGSGIDQFADKGEPEPTMALPGTQGKIDVLTRRAAAGLCLWSKEDAKGDDVLTSASR